MKRLGLLGVALALALSPTLHAQGRGPNQTQTSARDSTPRSSTRDSVPIAADTAADVPWDEPPHRPVKFSVTSRKVYNRVEGLPIMLGPALTLETPALDVDGAAYGIVRTVPGIRVREPDAGHDAHLQLRFGPAHRFGITAQMYDVVAPVERWQITEPEAGLAAFLLHRDYLDYYDRHGGGVSAHWYITDKANVAVGYDDARWGSRRAWKPFSLFRNGEPWRDDPAMDAGRVHLLTLEGTLDTRNDAREPVGGWYLAGSYEHGRSASVVLAPRSSSTGGGPSPAATPLHYGRLFVDVRRYNRVSPRSQLNGRIVFGGWMSGDELPLERKLSLGGPGTLPGYDFHVPVGRVDGMLCTTAGAALPTFPALCDRVMLGQLEFRSELTTKPLGVGDVGPVHLRDFGLSSTPIGVLFVDAGRGWRMREPWPSAYRTDAGGGVDFGLLGIYVAKALTDWSIPAHILVRVRQRF